MTTDQFPLSPDLIAQASEILSDVVEKTPVMLSSARICKSAVLLRYAAPISG